MDRQEFMKKATNGAAMDKVEVFASETGWRMGNGRQVGTGFIAGQMRLSRQGSSLHMQFYADKPNLWVEVCAYGLDFFQAVSLRENEHPAMGRIAEMVVGNRKS